MKIKIKIQKTKQTNDVNIKSKIEIINNELLIELIGPDPIILQETFLSQYVQWTN